MNWPLVSREKYDELDWEFRRVRLELEVTRSELTHYQRRRRELLNEIAKLTRQNVDLVRERDAWRAEAVK
jgi:chromosome segregation ATPase